MNVGNFKTQREAPLSSRNKGSNLEGKESSGRLKIKTFPDQMEEIRVTMIFTGIKMFHTRWSGWKTHVDFETRFRGGLGMIICSGLLCEIESGSIK